MEMGLQEIWSVAEFVLVTVSLSTFLGCFCLFLAVYMDKSHHKALPRSQGLVGPLKKSVFTYFIKDSSLIIK